MRIHRTAGLLASVGTAGVLAVAAAVPASADLNDPTVTIRGVATCAVGVPTAVSINTDPPVENRTTGVGPTGVYSVTLSNVPPFGKKARASVSCSVPAANFQNTFVVDRPPAPGDTILTVNLA